MYWVIIVEGEGDVGDFVGDQCMWQFVFDVFVGVDKVLCVVVMFFDIGGDGKDIGVEDNIFWWEVDFFGQDFVGVMVNFNFMFVGVGLINFVESYYYYCGVVVVNQFCMVDKGFDVFFY